jgi:hypothetical protein
MATSTLVTDYLGYGTAASRPASPSLPTGGIGIYFATDTGAVGLSSQLNSMANGDILSNISGSFGVPTGNKVQCYSRLSAHNLRSSSAMPLPSWSSPRCIFSAPNSHSSLVNFVPSKLLAQTSVRSVISWLKRSGAFRKPNCLDAHVGDCTRHS